MDEQTVVFTNLEAAMNTNHSPNPDQALNPPPALNRGERRYLPRWEVNSRVLCRYDDDTEPLEGRSIDLSCTGVGMITRHPVPPQQKIKLVIYLTETKAFEVEGHVVWQKPSLYGYLSGVNFADVPTNVQETILRFAFEVKKRDLISHWYEGWNGEKTA